MRAAFSTIEAGGLFKFQILTVLGRLDNQARINNRQLLPKA